MTTPGSQGAQQAYQQQVRQNSSTFHRNAAYQDQVRRHRPASVVRRVLGFVFSLLFALVTVGIFLAIMTGQTF